MLKILKKLRKNHDDRFKNSTKCYIIIDENKIPIRYSFRGTINNLTQT